MLPAAFLGEALDARFDPGMSDVPGQGGCSCGDLPGQGSSTRWQSSTAKRSSLAGFSRYFQRIVLSRLTLGNHFCFGS